MQSIGIFVVPLLVWHRLWETMNSNSSSLFAQIYVNCLPTHSNGSHTYAHNHISALRHSSLSWERLWKIQWCEKRTNEWYTLVTHCNSFRIDSMKFDARTKITLFPPRFITYTQNENCSMFCRKKCLTNPKSSIKLEKFNWLDQFVWVCVCSVFLGKCFLESMTFYYTSFNPFNAFSSELRHTSIRVSRPRTDIAFRRFGSWIFACERRKLSTFFSLLSLYSTNAYTATHTSTQSQ